VPDARRDEIAERSCAMARRCAGHLAAYDSIEILNQVVLNQVPVRFLSADGDHDGWTRTVAIRLHTTEPAGWAQRPGVARRPCGSP
jgi:hypothetical protein